MTSLNSEPGEMSNCQIDHSDYKNNGLITKIWGGPGWIFNHSVTFGYPLEPTATDKIKYKNYFTALGDVLPCRYCRESYIKFISTGDTALTDDALADRRSLTKWFYRVHQAVNAKLEMTYAITYEDVVDKYESFRAKCGKTAKGCVAPLDYKAFSFKKLYHLDAAIIPLNIAEEFLSLARMRGLDQSYFSYIQFADNLDGNFDLLKQDPSWSERNEYCQEQIRYMRENAVPSIEPSGGLWAGTPTIDELKLIMMLSSNLNRSELINAARKVGKRISVI